jgi:plastocyanin
MRSRVPFNLLAVLTVALTSLALAACGSDDNEDSGSAGSSSSTGSADKAPASVGEKLTLDALEKGPGRLAFSKKALTAESGEVTIVMTNPAGNQAPHAIEIEGDGVEEAGETVGAGGTSTVTADLEPGKYEFYCPVGDHKEQGMEGTLTVR